MGASFRKTTQILDLAGCDLLTISPDLLQKLEAADGDVPRKLIVAAAEASDVQRVDMDEEVFRWMHNEDAMATEKLADGHPGVPRGRDEARRDDRGDDRGDIDSVTAEEIVFSWRGLPSRFAC